VSYTCKTYGFYALIDKNKKFTLNILLRELFRAILLCQTSCQVLLLRSSGQNTVYCRYIATFHTYISPHGVLQDAACIVGYAGACIEDLETLLHLYHHYRSHKKISGACVF